MRKVLVIEDEDIVLEPLCDLLRYERFEVISAVSGEEGVRKAQAELPDIILCDVMLPGLDGYGVLKAVRAEASTAQVPLIFLTARTERTQVREGMELGADDYLCKPVGRRELLAAMHTQLAKRRQLLDMFDRRLEATSQEIASAVTHEMLTPLTAILGFAELMSIVEEDVPRDKCREMADGILQGAERLHKTVRHFLDYITVRTLCDQPLRIEDLRRQPIENAARLIESAARKAAQEAGRLEDLRLDLQPGPLALPAFFADLVVLELVSNAFKFSASGTPVTVRFSPAGQGGQLSVQDVGRGMSEQEVRSIGPFRQFERAQFEQQGLGLGLEIVRLVAELFGGELGLESQPGAGTQARFRLGSAPKPPLPAQPKHGRE